MQIVLASYFEEDNHGSGRKIGISPGKPGNLNYNCDSMFEPFSPGQLYWDFHKNKKDDYEGAGEVFSSGYREKLNEFVEMVNAEAKDKGISPLEVLPFKDGDTLLSWEKAGHTSYRTMLADFLRELGYEVEEN